MTQEQQLAELLHEQYCQYNHTDGCDWFYCTWENPRWARQRYLDWAGRLLSDGRLTFDTIMKHHQAPRGNPQSRQDRQFHLTSCIILKLNTSDSGWCCPSGQEKKGVTMDEIATDETTAVHGLEDIINNISWENILSRARKGLDLITSKGHFDRLNPYTLTVQDPGFCPAAQVGNGSFEEGLKLLGLDYPEYSRSRKVCQEHGFLAENIRDPGVNAREYALLTQAFKELLGA